MATVWMTVTVLYWNAESRTSYTIYPFKKYKFTHYCMWDIDWKRLFRNVWIIEDMVDPQYLAAPFSHCKPWSTTWSTTVALISSDKRLCGPYFIWYAPLWPLFHLISASVLGLFCLFLCFASLPFHHASLLLFFLSSVGPDHFLYVHPSSEFVILVLSSVYMLSNWRFMKCTFELFQRTDI